MEKERQAGYELLRIAAMAMVITLHYLSKGGFLTDPAQPFQAANRLAWLLEAFCVGAVDLYVLISGYFLTDASFRPGRLLRLWGQVFFYSVGVPALALVTGVLPAGEVTADRLLTWLFPVLREHYWFVTAYVVLSLFAPFLGRAARAMPQRELLILLALLYGMFSISSSLLPFDLPLDRGGYDGLWFLVLFLTAAYLRLYGLPPLQKKGRGLVCYVGCSLLIYGLSGVCRAVFLRTGRLGDLVQSPYHYNHFLCVFAALGLFCAFGRVRMADGRWKRAVLRVASCTFGVYLLHENDAVRYLWQDWFLAERLRGTLAFPLGVCAAVIGVYAAGIAAELLRRGLCAAARAVGARLARTGGRT